MPRSLDLLEDLRQAYESGNLIVFAGAGVSAAGGLPTRLELAKHLRDRLHPGNAPPEALDELDCLLARGELIDALSAEEQMLGPQEFCRAVERALDDKDIPLPNVAEAIGALRPKLRAVLTTNLDRFLVRAFKGEWSELTLASSAGDVAQRPHHILKLRGTLGNWSSWVLTREQHDRLMSGTPEYRNICCTLFRACPLLFIGYGTAEDDFAQVLKEVRALSGEQPPTHFAFVPAPVPPFRRTQLEKSGLRLIEYEDVDGKHAKVVEILRDLSGPPPINAGTTSAGPQAGSRPRVLVAGPYFGLSPEAAARVRQLWAEGLTKEGQDRIGAELQRNDVLQAQIMAIVAHDVIVDMSPWRAFKRWSSDGLRELERGGYDAGDVPLVHFGFPADAAPASADNLPEAALQQMRARWLLILARVGEQHASAIALGGFEGAPAWFQAAATLCPGAELVVDSEPPALEKRRLRRVKRLDVDAADLTEREYLRALRVVAGQVRLAGEAEARALHDVFIMVEILPFGRRDDEERPTRRRDADEEARGSGADDLGAELKARAAVTTRFTSGTAVSAEAVLDLAQRVFLWGQAGTGKSTLLQWLACRAARASREIEEARLPVWIPRLHGRSGDDLPGRLITLAFEALHLPIDRRSPLYRALEGRISSGRAHLFIDSLDEASNVAQALLTKLHSRIHVHVASRMTEPVQGRFTEVELKGLPPSGTGSFVRAYFGDVPWLSSFLRELHDLPDGSTWARTPVLLSIAAAYYRRKQRLAGSTLDLYAEVIGLTEDTEDRGLARPLDRVIDEAQVTRAQIAHELSRLARRMLAPDEGEPTVTFPESDLPWNMREALRRSGLFTGTALLRFAHLTFGEYFAARSGLDLSAARARWISAARMGREESLEVLPMAHAVEGAAALQAALEDAETRDAPDHRMLRLLLRSLRYGGDGVSAFCEERGARVLDLLLARMQMPSGRFGEAERRLLDAAEPALLVLAPFLKAGLGGPAANDRVLESMLDMPGEVGTEAHVIARMLGLRAPERRTSRWWSAIHRVARAMVRSGLGVREVVALTQGGERYERDDAVRVLARFRPYRAVLRSLVRDPSDGIREDVIRALSDEPEAVPLLRERLWDDEGRVRAAAVRALKKDPPSEDMLGVCLDDRHAFVQFAAIGVLEMHPERWDLLRHLISDQRTDVAADAIDALRDDASSRELIRARLQKSLEHGQLWYIPNAAVRALRNDPASRELVARALACPDVHFRAETLKALMASPEWRTEVIRLAEGGDASAIAALADDPGHRPLLQSLLKHDSEHTRRACVEALAADPDAGTLLRDHLHDPDPNVRNRAIDALAKHPSARPLLRDLLRTDEASNPDDPRSGWQRAHLVSVLAGDEGSLPLILRALSDRSADVRAAAASALASVASVRAELRKLLDDDDPRVWGNAVEVFADEPQVREQLRSLLYYDLWPVRLAAFLLLVNQEGARRQLQDMLHNDPRARAAAFQPLASDPGSRALLCEIFGSVSESEQLTLMSVLKGEPKLKRVARERLDRALIWRSMLWPQLARGYVQLLADDPESAPLLSELFHDEVHAVAAAVAPAMVGNPEAKPRLFELLRSEDAAARKAAVEALSTDVDAVQTLRQILQNDDDHNVRAAAAEALATDAGSRVALRELLSDRDKKVRTAAFHALANDREEHPRLWVRLAQEEEDELRAEIAAFLAAEPASSPEARAQMRSCLTDPFSGVRTAASKALSPLPASPGVPLAKVPSLRLALHLHGLHRGRLCAEDYALQSRLDEFVRRKESFVLESDPELAEAVLGWLCVRLGWASPDGSLDRGGRLFGEVREAPASLLAPAPPLLIRVAMDSSELPMERWLHPTHNVIEAWHVAKKLRARTAAPAIILACADVDFSDLVPQDLLPGQVSWGPAFFGFRIPCQDQAP
ncbi:MULTISPECIES: HEAT repeat domain-containing protein [Sorangium]|uniref:NACHT domain-containing protein n=1 Tax=Sorangium cellulosum (strain So ce56) TaxID=448385 RepID=A9G5J6_SORC5|nr:HEAT repeat domain-containing protein [Sorangium cellulosum]CAN99038.1 hypothetical protein sce8866 [Sorangium cellulosum So ce56]